MLKMRNKGFNTGIPLTATAWLIIVNVALFLLVRLVGIAADFNLGEWLALGAGMESLVHRPWTVVTYMFLQVDVVNLIFNMLWLWAFGTIVERCDGNRALWSVYGLSGLAGGLTFSFTSSFPAYLAGASAGVLGLMTFAAVSHPRLQLNLFLFGNVSLVWVAAVAIILCGVAPGLENTPTLLSHVGGAVAGLAVALIKRYGRHVGGTKPGMPPFRSKLKSKPLRVRQQEKRGLSAAEQTELDNLLRQVGSSGFKSLDIAQRKRLFFLSDKINRNTQ